MTFPKTIEHSKQYLVNIQLFGDRLVETNPLKLNYLATSFDIDYSGGSEFINQKGKQANSIYCAGDYNCFLWTVFYISNNFWHNRKFP